MFAHFKLGSCYHHSCYVLVEGIVAMSVVALGLFAYNITKQFKNWAIHQSNSFQILD